jgi:hypothetical protein
MPTEKEVRQRRQKYAEGRINGGMVTMIDAADLPDNTFQVARNARIRFDKTSRRFGSVLLDPTKPNNNPVLKLFYAKLRNGNSHTLRFTRNSLHTRAGGGWTPIVGTLTGTDTDRITAAVVLDKVIFTNNGVNKIQVVDFAGNTFGDLGNAGLYRYVTGFSNRAIAAAKRNNDEVEVAWSADGVITEWDHSVNPSAGSAPIIDSPSDLGDFITGIMGFTNILLLLRENSVWTATKQPSETDPFFFRATYPGVGCDCPYTFMSIQNGAVWLDIKTGTVWAYTPGSAPEPIGRPIEATLISGVNDARQCFASYSPNTNEYQVFLPQVGSDVTIGWIYNFRTKAWAYDEFRNISCADDVQLATSGTTIDELGDVPIDNLLLTIDELSPTRITIPTRTYGKTDGDILVETPTATSDAGVVYNFELRSKVYVVPEEKITVCEVRIEYIQRVGGSSFLLQYSRNGGETDSSWKTVKTVSNIELGKSKLIRHVRAVTCRKFAWRIMAENGAFDFLSYEVDTIASGEASK